MKCKRCDTRMHVTVTTSIGRSTLRYLKCPKCGATDQSIESFRDGATTFDTTCSVKEPHKQA
jgi:Zn finger protein HypA/HybF involved in hydrogenase expression